MFLNLLYLFIYFVIIQLMPLQGVTWMNGIKYLKQGLQVTSSLRWSGQKILSWFVFYYLIHCLYNLFYYTIWPLKKLLK